MSTSRSIGICLAFCVALAAPAAAQDPTLTVNGVTQLAVIEGDAVTIEVVAPAPQSVYAILVSLQPIGALEQFHGALLLLAPWPVGLSASTDLEVPPMTKGYRFHMVALTLDEDGQLGRSNPIVVGVR